MSGNEWKKLSGIFRVIYVIFSFVFALMAIIALMDVIVMPFLSELFQEPHLARWCGVFSRCSNQIKISLSEYISMGGLWTGLDGAKVKYRMKSAILLGLLLGVGYVGISFFRRRL